MEHHEGNQARGKHVGSTVLEPNLKVWAELMRGYIACPV